MHLAVCMMKQLCIEELVRVVGGKAEGDVSIEEITISVEDVLLDSALRRPAGLEHAATDATAAKT